MAFEYPQPRPALSIDCVVLGIRDGALKTCLVRRGDPPFADCWSLPTGDLRLEESLVEAARRSARDQIGLADPFFEPLEAFGDVGRDPRERSISIAFLVLSAGEEPGTHQGDRQYDWFSVVEPPRLAFDHRQILTSAIERLRRDLPRRPLAFELLPNRFPLRDLQTVYEAVFERPVDKRNFRKKLLSLGIVKELRDQETGVAHRAARLYQFDRRAYQQRLKRGLPFELA